MNLRLQSTYKEVVFQNSGPMALYEKTIMKIRVELTEKCMQQSYFY